MWKANLTVPNAITMVRLALILAFGVLLARHHDAWAITTLAIAGVSDFFDGFLARKLKQTSPLGAVLDPAADRLLTVVVVLGLALRDIIPWWLVGILLARDIVMAVTLLWLRSKTTATPKVTRLGKWATFGLYVFLPLSYLAFERWDAVHTLAIVGSLVAAVAYWGAAGQYVRQARDLSARAGASA